MSTASPAILLNFFEKQSAQNHPQYLSGLLRALFPTTFLEIAVSYLFLWRHTYRSGIVWTDTLWKGMTKPVPVVHISAVWGSFWGQSRDDNEYHPCYWCFSLETCLNARISGFSISEQSNCLLTQHLSWSRIGESVPLSRERAFRRSGALAQKSCQR